MDAVQYDVSELVTLKDYLGLRLSMEQLLSVFSQIISVAMALDGYLLDNSMLITDMGRIYYDCTAKEVRMIYLLLADGGCPCRPEEKLFGLFKEIIFSAKFVVGDGDRYIAELLNSLNDDNGYSLAEFRELVCRLEKAVSGGPDKQAYKPDGYSGIPVRTPHMPLPEVTEEPEACYGNVYGDAYGDEAERPGVRRECVPERADGGTWLSSFVRKIFGRPSGGEDEAGTGEYVIEGAFCTETVEESAEDDGDGETTVLVRGCMGTHTPYLVRSSNKERIAINKRSFKIGKDSRYADYIISDNAAVSRAHAQFTVRDGKVYLIDEDSLNNTYVNGNALVSRHEQEVNGGDVIMFADEEFVLYC